MNESWDIFFAARRGWKKWWESGEMCFFNRGLGGIAAFRWVLFDEIIGDSWWYNRRA